MFKKTMKYNINRILLLISATALGTAIAASCSGVEPELRDVEVTFGKGNFKNIQAPYTLIESYRLDPEINDIGIRAVGDFGGVRMGDIRFLLEALQNKYPEAKAAQGTKISGISQGEEFLNPSDSTWLNSNNYKTERANMQAAINADRGQRQ